MPTMTQIGAKVTNRTLLFILGIIILVFFATGDAFFFRGAVSILDAVVVGGTVGARGAVDV